MPAKVSPPPTATGVVLLVVEPLPSWPLAFRPQQYAAPPVVRPHVKSRAALMAANTRPTVTVADPICASPVAVIVAEPVARPVTSPVADTDAMAGAPVAQVTTLPGIGFPAASLGVAVNCTLSPTTTVAAAGTTVTEATGPDPTTGAVGRPPHPTSRSRPAAARLCGVNRPPAAARTARRRYRDGAAARRAPPLPRSARARGRRCGPRSGPSASGARWSAWCDQRPRPGARPKRSAPRLRPARW